jgi:O-antigen ligase
VNAPGGRRSTRTLVQYLDGWVLLVPGALTLVLAFRAGGFFANVTGTVAGALCILLLLRITSTGRPFEGWSVPLAIAAGGLTLFAVWTLASAGWSHSASRALVEFDRALLYVGVLALVGSRARTPGALPAVLRWVAAAIAVACAAALLTRLLPATFPAGENINNERLGFPLTYWNAMGVFAALGLVLALHFTATDRERPWVRVVAASTLPVIAVTLYFTFSRGGIGAAAVGVVAYLIAAHPRSLLGALPAGGVPTAIAVKVAYGADLLARADYASPAAAGQGRTVLWTVLACAAAAAALRAAVLPLDRRLARIPVTRTQRLRAYAAAAAVAVVAVAGASVAFDLPGRLSAQRDEFSRSGFLPGTADLRNRLTQVGSNGRIELWRVAREERAAQPFHGTGAGTYRLEWERKRPAPPTQVNDAHSLYLEVLGELGWVGFLALGVAVLTPLLVAARRLAGRRRHVHAAFLAASLTLLLHAGVDWDWEMPVLFVWFFGAAGALLAAPRAARAGREMGNVGRVLGGLACLLVAVTPITVALSQSRLNTAVAALSARDCGRAVDDALGSLHWVGLRPEPFEVLGWCDLRGGQAKLGLDAMRAAESRDPGNWEYAYGVAVAQALAGQDPRAAAQRALERNPLEPLAKRFARAVRRDDPKAWRRAGARAQIPGG